MGSMLAMASIYLPLPTGAQARAQKQGRSGSVGCRSAGKQGEKFLFSGTVAILSTSMRGEEEEDGDQSILQKGGIHRAHSLTYPGKTCFRCLAGSPGAWAGGCSRLLSPFVITISTWDTVKSFMLHLALQPHPILAAVSSHKAAVLSQKRLLREQLFPATSPGAPPPGSKQPGQLMDARRGMCCTGC